MSILTMTRVARHARREKQGSDDAIAGATAAIRKLESAGGSADGAAAVKAAAEAAAKEALEKAATEASKAADKARKNVMTYIPTEVITMYIAAMGVLLGAKSKVQLDPWTLFYIAWIITPIVVILVFMGTVKIEEKRIPAPKEWPWFAVAASAFAFWGWAFAMPNSPYGQLDWYSNALGGFGVVIVSTILGLFARIFG